MSSVFISPNEQTLKVALGGLGAVGLPTAKWLDKGIAGLELVAISAGNKDRARNRVSMFNVPPPVLDLRDLANVADVIVECSPPECFAAAGMFCRNRRISSQQRAHIDTT